MKKLFNLLTLILVGVLMFSCERTNDNDKILGFAVDNIKLSQKIATINSNTNVIDITTQSIYWQLNNITLDGIKAELGSIHKSSENFIFTTSDYELERKEDGKRIVITMNQNTTNSDRKLIVQLSLGNYFDRIQIVQNK